MSDGHSETQFQEDGATKRIEIVPLEALRLSPDEVLVLRLPGHVTKEYVEEIQGYLKAIGIKDRVIFMAGEVEVTVIGRD